MELKIYFVPTKDSNNPHIINMTCRFTNGLNDVISNYNFQVAVPKVKNIFIKKI